MSADDPFFPQACVGDFLQFLPGQTTAVHAGGPADDGGTIPAIFSGKALRCIEVVVEHFYWEGDVLGTPADAPDRAIIRTRSHETDEGVHPVVEEMIPRLVATNLVNDLVVGRCVEDGVTGIESDLLCVSHQELIQSPKHRIQIVFHNRLACLCQTTRFSQVSVGPEDPVVLPDEFPVKVHREGSAGDVPAIVQREKSVDARDALGSLELLVVEEKPHGETGILVRVVDVKRTVGSFREGFHESALQGEIDLHGRAHGGFPIHAVVMVIVEVHGR